MKAHDQFQRQKAFTQLVDFVLSNSLKHVKIEKKKTIGKRKTQIINLFFVVFYKLLDKTDLIFNPAPKFYLLYGIDGLMLLPIYPFMIGTFNCHEDS